jgi:phosphatase NudJ
MSTPRWSPSVTVAAIVEQGGRYLLVEEQTPEGLRLNNPAGHLDPGESLVQGAVREALEETARDFHPEALLGVYLSRFQRAAADGSVGQDITYLRFAFAGTVGEPIPGRSLDREIVRTLWMSLDEARDCRSRHRSPLLLQCLEDHAAGRRYPLEALTAHPSLFAPYGLDGTIELSPTAVTPRRGGA